MSINSKCYLPNDVRAEDVVQSIAYLCGARRLRQDLSDGGSWAAWFGRDEVMIEPNSKPTVGCHVSIRPTHDMQYYTIHISPTTCDNSYHEGSLFLYPNENYLGHILLYAGVSEFWQKIGRALVDMFGGYIDDNDCDSVDVDYKKRKPRKVNCPSDGEPWQKFQEDMFDLPKLFEFVEKP